MPVDEFYNHPNHPIGWTRNRDDFCQGELSRDGSRSGVLFISKMLKKTILPMGNLDMKPKLVLICVDNDSILFHMNPQFQIQTHRIGCCWAKVPLHPHPWISTLQGPPLFEVGLGNWPTMKVGDDESLLGYIIVVAVNLHNSGIYQSLMQPTSLYDNHLDTVLCRDFNGQGEIPRKFFNCTQS